jgi:hypothetical protein
MNPGAWPVGDAGENQPRARLRLTGSGPGDTAALDQHPCGSDQGFGAIGNGVVRV